MEAGRDHNLYRKGKLCCQVVGALPKGVFGVVLVVSLFDQLYSQVKNSNDDDDDDGQESERHRRIEVLKNRTMVGEVGVGIAVGGGSKESSHQH